jgi:spoIIIJ-associated protein
MRAVESEGTTVDEAIQRALILLDLSLEDVDVEVVREAGAGRSTAVVRVSPKGALTGQVPSSDVESVSRETRQRERDVGIEEEEQARSVLVEILSRMGLSCRVDPGLVDDDGQRIRLSVSGEDAAIVIGKQGQTLDAIEFFVGRAFERRCPGAPHVSVDAEGYRERRAQKIAEMAIDRAAIVRRSGRAVALEPMSPRDRRAVHVALKDEAGVSTRSEGEGPGRHIVIEPSRPLGLGLTTARIR